jgi:LmbE family N-acetylglucosaminyl deacetylase
VKSLKLNNTKALVFVHDCVSEDIAITRTTDLCIAAHQDDIEIMAYSPIVKCFGKSDKWFTGVVVTDGAGSPRSGIYEKYSDEDMKQIRITEQKTAATVGKYSAQLLLAYSSKEVKDANSKMLVNELANIIEKASPEILYTHNLADKHDTHVSVALRTIAAIRKLPLEKRPKKVYSLEVWRGLDWLCDEDKTVLDTSKHPNLAAALLGVFDSQIAGGKRYDNAALGRRIANATFFASHATDDVESASYALDITELVNDETIKPQDFIIKYIDNFKKEITERIERFSL